MGKLLAINISKERGTEKREVPQAELVADYGIMGDAHAGKWHRQVSLLSAEKIDAFRARGAQIDNGAFGENLIISGFDFKNLPLGTRFCIGDAILEMTQIGKQCHSHCAIYKRMGECIMPKEGVFAVVIRGGQIYTGDEVKLIPANIYASIKDRPADSRCELLTVIEGAHAGEKALYIDGRIRVASGSAWADEINDNDNSIVMFKQQIGSRPRLIICGGGHVSVALVRMASLLAFDIWVIEDRPLFADNAKRQGADHVICGDYKKTLARLESQADDYYVCMTRGHRFDMECLTEIFRKPYAYVGMMGSLSMFVQPVHKFRRIGEKLLIPGISCPSASIYRRYILYQMPVHIYNCNRKRHFFFLKTLYQFFVLCLCVFVISAPPVSERISWKQRCFST